METKSYTNKQRPFPEKHIKHMVFVDRWSL